MLRLTILLVVTALVVSVHGAPIKIENIPRAGDVCKQFANQYEPFDYFLLSIQWPGSACFGKKPGECSIPDFVNDFTIHGLWPQYKNPATYPECCFNIPFDLNALNPIRDAMNNNWPSYYHPNDYFWNHEWLKHGTCANSTMTNEEFIYFSNTLQIHSRMHLVDVLKKASITPSHGSYSVQRMEDAFKAAGFPGIIACTRDQSTIEEVRFCLSKDLQFMTCDQALINDIHTHNACKNTISYPPIH